MPRIDDEQRNQAKQRYVPPPKYTPKPQRPMPQAAPAPRPVPQPYGPPAPKGGVKKPVYGPPVPASKSRPVQQSKNRYADKKIDQVDQKQGKPKPNPYRASGDADMDVGGTAAYNPRNVDDLPLSQITPQMAKNEAFQANLDRQRMAEEQRKRSNWQRLASVAAMPVAVMGDIGQAIGRSTNAASDAAWNAVDYARGRSDTYDPARPRTAEAIASGIQQTRNDLRQIPGSELAGNIYGTARRWDQNANTWMQNSNNLAVKGLGYARSGVASMLDPIEESFRTSSPERVRSVYRDSGGGDGFVNSVNARGQVWQADPGLDQLSQMANPVNVGASVLAPVAATGRLGQGAKAAATGWNAINEAVDPLSLAARGAGAARRNIGAAVDDWRFQQQAMGITPGRKPQPYQSATSFTRIEPKTYPWFPEPIENPSALKNVEGWEAEILKQGSDDAQKRAILERYGAIRPQPGFPSARQQAYNAIPEDDGGQFLSRDPLNDVELPGRQQPRFDQPTTVNPTNPYRGAIQTQYADPTADEAISRLGIPDEPQQTQWRQDRPEPVVANRQPPMNRRFGGPSEGTSGSEGLRQVYSEVEARNADRWTQYQAELDGQGVPAEARQDLRSPAYDDFFRRWQTEIQELAGADPRLSFGGWSKNHNLKAETTSYLNALRDSGRYTPTQELWQQMRRDLPQTKTQTVSRSDYYGSGNRYPQGQAQANTVNLWQEMFGLDGERGIDRAGVDRLLQQAENPLADPRVQEYARRMQESLQTERMFQDMMDRTERGNPDAVPFSYNQDYQDRLRLAEQQLPPRRGQEDFGSDWESREEAFNQPEYEGLPEAIGYGRDQLDAEGRSDRFFGNDGQQQQPPFPSPYGADYSYWGGRPPRRAPQRGSASTRQMSQVIGRGEPQVPQQRTPEQVMELINSYPEIDKNLKNPEVQQLIQEYQNAVRTQTQPSSIDPNLGMGEGRGRMSEQLVGRRSEFYRENNPMQVDPRQQRLANRFVQNLQNISPLDRQEIARSIADEGGASMLLNQVGYRARSQMIIRPGSQGPMPTDYSNWNDSFTDVLIGIANSEQGFRQVNPGDLTPQQLNSAINGIEARAGSNALPETERMRLQDLAYNLRGLRDELENLDTQRVEPVDLRIEKNVGPRPNPYASPREMLGMERSSGNPLVDALTKLARDRRDKKLRGFGFDPNDPTLRANGMGLGAAGAPQGDMPDPDFDNLAQQVDSQSGPRPNSPAQQPLNRPQARVPTPQPQGSRIGRAVNRLEKPAQRLVNSPLTKIAAGASAAGLGIAGLYSAAATREMMGRNLQDDAEWRRFMSEQSQEKDERFERQQKVYDQDEADDRAYSQQNQARMNADQLFDQVKATLPPDQWALLDGISRSRLEQIYVQNAGNQAKAEADAQAYIQQQMGGEPPSWVEQEIIGADLALKDAERFYEEIQKSPDYSPDQKRDAENALWDARDARNYFSRWFIERNGVTEQDREKLALRLGVDYDEVMAATPDFTQEDAQFYDTEYGQQLQSFQLPGGSPQGGGIQLPGQSLGQPDSSGPTGSGNVSPAPKLPPGRSRTAPQSSGGNAGQAVPNAGAGGQTGSSRPSRPAATGRPARPAAAGRSGGGENNYVGKVRPNPFTGVWEVWNGTGWQKSAEPVSSSSRRAGGGTRSAGFAPDPRTGYAGKGVGPSGGLESTYVVNGQQVWESQLSDYQRPQTPTLGTGVAQTGRQPDPRTGYVGQTIGPSGMLETMYEIDGQVYYESQLQRYQAPDIYGQDQQKPVRDWNDGPRGDESMTRRHPVNGWERWIDPDGSGPMPVGWYGDMAGGSSGGSGASFGSGGGGSGRGYGSGGGSRYDTPAGPSINSWDDLSVEERTALTKAIQGNASWYDPRVQELMTKYGISRKKLLDMYMKPAEYLSYPRQSAMSRYL